MPAIFSTTVSAMTVWPCSVCSTELGLACSTSVPVAVSAVPGVGPDCFAVEVMGCLVLSCRLVAVLANRESW